MRMFLVILILCPFAYSLRITENMKKIKFAKDKILNGYDKLIAPENEHSNWIMVESDLRPQQIIDVDEMKCSLTLDSILCMWWNDARLQWSEYEYNGTLVLPPHLVWTPEINFMNSYTEGFIPKSDVLLTLDHYGNITWCPRIHTETSCPSIMEATYPYDEVQCNITMASWVRIDRPIIHFGWMEELDMYSFANVHQRWKLLSEKAMVDAKWRYPDNPYMEEVVDLVFSFKLIRRPLPEIQATWVPCILVLVLTLSVFWLSPNDFKKLLVLGFLFIALTVLIVYVAWHTKFSLGVLLATSFLLSAMYIVVATFLLQVLVIFNICKLTGPSRPPPAVMNILRGSFGKVLCISSPLKDNNPPFQNKEDLPATSDFLTPRDEWILFAAGLDRLFFVFILIAVISVHHL